LPFQNETRSIALILSLAAFSAHADLQFKSQTVTDPQMKTQQVEPAPAPQRQTTTGAPTNLNLPPTVPVLPGGIPLQKPLTPAEQALLNQKAAAARQSQAQQNQNTLDLINRMMSGPDNESSVNPKEKFEGMSQQIGPGIMEGCGQVPASAQEAYETAKNFRGKCSLANRGENQKIAVNDYSSVRMPYMYIFDTNGKCLGKTAVTYGNGAGPVRPLPCNDDGSHLTPPGFFLTSEHNGASYNSSNSLGLTGLEGQGSRVRGVLIHPAKAPGTASSWGCSGVGYTAFNTVKKSLGYGALVFNYFGNTGGPVSCRNKNGLSPAHNFCRLDSGAVNIPSESTSQGAPTTR
jgi:hypothetical protein